MQPLALDIINASTPYEVYWHEASRTYRFKSDYGVVLAIGFLLNYLLMPVSIEDMEGIENFAALIIRKDNPSILDIVSEFSNTVAMLRVKPDCLN